MKKYSLLIAFMVASIILTAQVSNQTKQIVIETKNVTLIYTVNSNQKVYQSYLGKRLLPDSYAPVRPGYHEAYVPSGLDNLFEPAIKLTHTDGNPSLELKYAESNSQQESEAVKHTVIRLKDPKYPVEVNLHFKAYMNEDIIKTWTEIRHSESKPVVLSNFASSMLHFDSPSYWLSQFHGVNKAEMKMQESRLTSGIKIIDSKLGTRADMYQSPVFFLSLNKLSDENSGELIAGTLAWTGNFQFAFELDEKNSLRVITGMNPFGSQYQLQPKQSFITPEFIFTYSNAGRGQASRNFHKWARNYGVLDGNKPRLTLLNNWEATFFDFNQSKLDTLINDASNLGADMFLLDDGWFGNKYPRDNDKAGLGDWQEDKRKLPEGIAHLVKEATAKGVKFGIWLEPEMVNPKSELYEKHPDWILKLPNRDEHYYRTQLVLDMTNPKVQEFVYNLVDGMLTKNPAIAYIKWDCNRMMTNTYSPYLKENQSHVYIEYVIGLYNTFARIRGKYPHLPMMLCSGGGGRTDYGGLKYFQEFWPSDNTDGMERVYIQWGYSYFFPSLAICSHVTTMGTQSLKFRTDVAMMGKLGYDIRVSEFSPAEMEFSRQAIQNYKRLSNVIWQGDLYRLVSPYEEKRAVVMYVDENKSKAVLFAYTLETRMRDVFTVVHLEGLDPKKKYTVKEINLMPGTKSAFYENGRAYTGEYLMNVGINVSSVKALTSAVFEITAN
ncbi:alpha-galactosidase [Arcticibacter tournemirensis]|uniref:Alpha-galactosidase n=1 Tax=Arcticibacter tournemirensis TaxID=699437 RepID=A0A5M9HD22_9SPHI|nr:alpha-galactosidase [Arcticibacter tournemirensis]KAA8484369.1 alpha-galactosidase [Arcticibacter tournemirensis]TQM49809.1 alpha-galactosidase [Arcticibacter tournemirensis]